MHNTGIPECIKLYKFLILYKIYTNFIHFFSSARLLFLFVLVRFQNRHPTPSVIFVYVNLYIFYTFFLLVTSSDTKKVSSCDSLSFRGSHKVSFPRKFLHILYIFKTFFLSVRKHRGQRHACSSVSFFETNLNACNF